MATAIDPICKMDVDTGNPPGGCRSNNDYTGFSNLPKHRSSIIAE